jgi:hypothetical protein
MYHGLPSEDYTRRGYPMVDPTPPMFRQQMKNPSETFSLLLIIGGEVVQKAIAQGAGLRINCVCFSFGWVAYAFSAMLSAFGDGRMMPDPDYPATVINPKSYTRKFNSSWVISRLIRDLEFEVEEQYKPFRNDKGIVMTEDDKPVKATTSGLLVTIYEVRLPFPTRSYSFKPMKLLLNSSRSVTTQCQGSPSLMSGGFCTSHSRSSSSV